MKLLWDLDGTIFDTYPAILNSFLSVHEAAHGTKPDAKEALRLLKQNSKIAFAHYGISDEFRQMFAELDHQQAETACVPFSGVKQVLEQADVNVIVTHRHRISVLNLLTKFDLLHYFDEIVSPEDDGFPRKPDAAAYLYLQEKHGIEWAVGDRSLDLIPAREAGMKTVAFQNPDIEADIHLDVYDKTFFQLLHSFS